MGDRRWHTSRSWRSLVHVLGFGSKQWNHGSTDCGTMGSLGDVARTKRRISEFGYLHAPPDCSRGPWKEMGSNPVNLVHRPGKWQMKTITDYFGHGGWTKGSRAFRSRLAISRTSRLVQCCARSKGRLYV